jgi:hypothetical protein
MLFAVAALILQLAPAPKLYVDAKASPAATGGSAEIAAGVDADSSAKDTDSESNKQASPSSIQPNFNYARLANDPTESSSSNKLIALSLEHSENSRSLSSIRVPAVQPIKPTEVARAEKRPPTRSWWALTIAQHGAAAFDAYTTRQAISKGAVEDDPLMRPFAHSAAIYAASQVCPVLLDLLSRRMMRSENPVFRRMWWVPQSGATAMFIFSGVHNLGVASRQ